MKKIIILLSALIGHVSIQAQNIDSLFYAGVDTSGLAKEIAAEEADWTWADTLQYGNYSYLDSYAMRMTKKYKNISDLAKDINQAFNTDEEKIRVIFMWMTCNIAYDYVECANKNRRIEGVTYTKRTTKLEIADKWENVYFKYATRVLRNKRGICEGYATLFYELCRYTNVNCEMVTGFASDDIDKIDKFKKQKNFPTNHAWNRVLLNGEWLYIDVTWASSGKYDRNRKRTEATYYNPAFYLVKESKLYPDHVVNVKQSKRRNEIVGNF